MRYGLRFAINPDTLVSYSADDCMAIFRSQNDASNFARFTLTHMRVNSVSMTYNDTTGNTIVSWS